MKIRRQTLARFPNHRGTGTVSNSCLFGESPPSLWMIQEKKTKEEKEGRAVKDREEKIESIYALPGGCVWRSTSPLNINVSRSPPLWNFLVNKWRCIDADCTLDYLFALARAADKIVFDFVGYWPIIFYLIFHTIVFFLTWSAGSSFQFWRFRSILLQVSSIF